MLSITQEQKWHLADWLVCFGNLSLCDVWHANIHPRPSRALIEKMSTLMLSWDSPAYQQVVWSISLFTPYKWPVANLSIVCHPAPSSVEATATCVPAVCTKPITMPCLEIAVLGPFSNPGISGLRNASPVILGLIPGLGTINRLTYTHISYNSFLESCLLCLTLITLFSLITWLPRSKPL